MYIRKTKKDDILNVLAIYRASVSYMRKQNNFEQWSDFEGLKHKILKDIYGNISYVVIDNNEIKAAFTLQREKEMTYENSTCSWMDETPYYTIHRLAVKEHQKGYASFCIRYSFYQNKHIRIDTHRDNASMLSLLNKFSFHRCGTITLEDKTERIVFEKTTSFSDLLLYYYKDYGRKLPWRENVSFYHTYLSEIMLQQTRVEAVKKYYERFLTVLPSLNDLANANEDVYLKLWEGLGYYSRVKNLHKGAIYILNQKEMPSTYTELIKVPGIGDYTAKAILSIVYQKNYIALDGNLMRIYSRLTCCEKDISSIEAKKEADFYFSMFLIERPGDFNQALMDLGEEVCLPNAMPKCSECPLCSFCKSYSMKKQLDYPKKKEKKERKMEEKTIYVIRFQDQYLLIKRPAEGLLSSLYGFYDSEKLNDIETAADFLKKKGFEINSIEPSINAKHIFSHIVWMMNGYLVTLKRKPSNKDYLFVTKEEIIHRYSLPSAYQKYKDIILQGKF